MSSWTWARWFVYSSGLGIASFATHQYISNSKKNFNFAEKNNWDHLKLVYEKDLPSRSEQLKNLTLESSVFDVLIIGGGATGSGIALDSVTRGFKTSLIELDDFSSGTSSRSTKLIHGGVRYLQKAVLNLDWEQFKMVKEALSERANLLEIAPHLSYPLPIMIPVYKWWQIPYFWIGIKIYDIVAGLKNVQSSYFLSKKKAIELFPMLQKDKLCGAIVYFDGQHNDAQMNLAIALTAARYGATVVNHCAVVDLIKDERGKLSGVKIRDELSGKKSSVLAKCIINATGPFIDSIRLMDNPSSKKLCHPSAGVHITLPGYYSPESMGLIDPATSDGRVIFFLPWQTFTIAGTTDKLCTVTHSPGPSEADIQFILNEIKKYLNPDINVRRGDVMSAWCGIRPLVLEPSKPNTESLSQNHIIEVSKSGLITIAGGKWTTYRKMAEDTIDKAIQTFPEKLIPKLPCQTKGLLLEGAYEWTPTMYIRLVQDFGFDPQVANHLSTTYGTRAFSIAKTAEITGHRWPVTGNRLHNEFPYINEEVRYAIKEYACTAVDVISRRLRLAFLNVEAAKEALPKIIEIMSQELKWNKKEQQEQYQKAIDFLTTQMGQNSSYITEMMKKIELSKDEINRFTKQFHSMDKDKKGYISINDLRRFFKSSKQKITEEELHSILSEVDVNKNGQAELGEFLALMSCMKKGTISQSRLATAVKLEYDKNKDQYNKLTVERSGSGL